MCPTVTNEVKAGKQLEKIGMSFRKVPVNEIYLQDKQLDKLFIARCFCRAQSLA